MTAECRAKRGIPIGRHTKLWRDRLLQLFLSYGLLVPQWVSETEGDLGDTQAVDTRIR